nr:hypothetical protein [Tanacetum cinerariifolium]
MQPVPKTALLCLIKRTMFHGHHVFSIINGSYVRRMIPESGDQNLKVPVNETFHEQTDDELTRKELKQEIWLRVQQMMKGSDIGIQEKKAKNKHFPEKIDSNLKFLNNLQPEWSRHVTIVHQTKDLHTSDYTQLYDFLKYNQKEMQMIGGNGKNQFRQYVGQNVGNQNGYNAVQNVRNQVVQNAVQNPSVQNVRNPNGLIVVPGIANLNPDENVNVVAVRAGVMRLRIMEFDLMAATSDLDEIEEVNANYILMANLQQTSTSGTQTDKAPVYDSDGSVEAHNYENCYDNEIFNMFTQEEHYTELLEPILEPHQVQQNDSNVISDAFSMEQDGGTIDQHLVNVEETRAYFESLYNNLEIEVEKVNSVNCKMKETNTDLTIELARYKNQENYFEISQEKYDKLERCYQKSVYQEQCLTKKMNALHLSFGKPITTLNEEISNLNKQLSKEKSIVSSLLEEKKKLMSDFKIRKDEFLDKQIQPEHQIKELDNILVKTSQSIQTMHMLSPKPDLFYHTEQKMALGYQNPFLSQASSAETTEVQNFEIQFLKEAAKFVRDFKSLTKEADESLAKHKALELEIKRLLRAVVSQDIMSIVQNSTVVETSDLQTELDCIKESYNDMQQKIKRLQAQLGDQKGVDNTAKTRRPQPRSNTKNDRVSFVSKSSCNKNKEVEVEEHSRNLLLSKNKKYMSPECNNVKLSI